MGKGKTKAKVNSNQVLKGSRQGKNWMIKSL